MLQLTILASVAAWWRKKAALNVISRAGILPLRRRTILSFALLERPFVLGHFDCWGLVMSYFRQTHGIELHDYRVDYPWWENDYPDNFYQDCWYECGFREFDGPPKPGDMVIMQVQADKWNHAGILLEGNMLLHHLYGHLSQRVPYGGYWQERTMKILRHQNFI